MRPKRKKQRLGSQIIEGLTELRDTLRKKEPLEKRFTVRTVELKLKPGIYDPESIRLARMSFQVSQAVFAQMLGVSPATIESWEQGHRQPSPMACRLLDEINRNRGYWIKLLRGSIKETSLASSN